MLELKNLSHFSFHHKFENLLLWKHRLTKNLTTRGWAVHRGLNLYVFFFPFLRENLFFLGGKLPKIDSTIRLQFRDHAIITVEPDQENAVSTRSPSCMPGGWEWEACELLLRCAERVVQFCSVGSCIPLLLLGDPGAVGWAHSSLMEGGTELYSVCDSAWLLSESHGVGPFFFLTLCI